MVCDVIETMFSDVVHAQLPQCEEGGGIYILVGSMEVPTAFTSSLSS